jgi:hypothetical protein
VSSASSGAVRGAVCVFVCEEGGRDRAWMCMCACVRSRIGVCACVKRVSESVHVCVRACVCAYGKCERAHAFVACVCVCTRTRTRACARARVHRMPAHVHMMNTMMQSSDSHLQWIIYIDICENENTLIDCMEGRRVRPPLGGLPPRRACAYRCMFVCV